MSVESQDFEQLLAEKQESIQREKFNRLLEKLAVAIQGNNSRLDAAVQNLQVAIEGLIETQKDTPVDVDGGQEEAILTLAEDLRKHVELLRVKKEWTISFYRDNSGFIKSPIILTQKQ